jgi:hypothetical protein
MWARSRRKWLRAAFLATLSWFFFLGLMDPNVVLENVDVLCHCGNGAPVSACENPSEFPEIWPPFPLHIIEGCGEFGLIILFWPFWYCRAGHLHPGTDGLEESRLLFHPTAAVQRLHELLVFVGRQPELYFPAFGLLHEQSPRRKYAWFLVPKFLLTICGIGHNIVSEPMQNTAGQKRLLQVRLDPDAYTRIKVYAAHQDCEPGEVISNLAKSLPTVVLVPAGSRTAPTA